MGTTTTTTTTITTTTTTETTTTHKAKPAPNMSSSTLPRVLSGYRRLFRARKKLFQKDEKAMMASRQAIREQFEKNHNATGAEHIEVLLSMIYEAEDMLLHGIVQGELNEDSGNYQVKVRPEHAGSASDRHNMEPITKEMGDNISKQQNPKVSVTKTTTGNGGKGNNYPT